MTHFVFGRAVRDSFLGNGIAIQRLPGLIAMSTVLSLVLSFVLSVAFRQMERARVVMFVFSGVGVSELFFASDLLPAAVAPSAFYVLISLASALTLSMVWLSAGTWFHQSAGVKERAVPVMLAAGTFGGLVAGFVVVQLPLAANFKFVNLVLASVNFVLAVLLNRPRTHEEEGRAGASKTDEATEPDQSKSRLVVIALATATVLGAAGSTLLDLSFRVTVAQRYGSRQELLHFFGYFQGLLGLVAVTAQLVLARFRSLPKGRSTMAVYAIGGLIAAGIGAVVPSFELLAVIRTGEYAMRNSLFRFGTEMAYSDLPDQLRSQARPLIDLMGERLGDGVAAGLLAFTLSLGQHVSLRWTLACLGMMAMILWKVCESLSSLSRQNSAQQVLPEDPTASDGVIY